MTITPSSNIILLKTPMELSDNNQLTWSSLNEQYTYFSGLPKLELEDATYQRKEGVIRFPTNPTTTYEDLLQYNYCMYQNEAYNNKWFYAYITEINYVNDGMSTIKLETDVWNTWWNDITFKKSFVEREHVNNDTIGLHTIPENVELGEFIINNAEEMDNRANNFFICMGLSRVPSDMPHVNDSRLYNNIYSGLFYIIFDQATSCSKMIKAMDDLGYGSDIYTIFMIPTSLSFSNTWYTASLGDETDIRFAVIQTSTSATSLVSNKQITINSTLDGYTPKNKKLFTYPYNYLYMTNNGGIDAVYRYEDFTNNTPSFNIDGAICTGCSIKLYPLNYKKQNTSTWSTACYTYGMVGNKYPTCSWLSDSYTNWLTQNAVNIGISLVTDFGKIGIGMGAGGLAGSNSVVGGLTGIANTLSEVYQASFMPNQAKGNVAGGDITCANGQMGFNAYQMSIRNEYAKVIDNYFTMFGYKVNTLKIPNITGRTYWNYVKTINCNLIGDIPQIDLGKIRELFDNGITFWHDTSKFLDYSQNNTIVS